MLWMGGCSPVHNAHIVQYVYIATEQGGTYLQSPSVWHYSTYINPTLFGCEINIENSISVNFKLWFCDFPSFIPLYQLQGFGVFCHNSGQNTWEFYYPPVANTGHFWIQGDPTVQCADCAVQYSGENLLKNRANTSSSRLIWVIGNYFKTP